ncbi:MAG: hypothetical protein R3C18_09900 [Planctomycetaceae bacterium]
MRKVHIPSIMSFIMSFAGGFLCFIAIQEMRVSAGASQVPVSVNLADLELGAPAPNKNLQLGEHLALFPTFIGQAKMDSDYKARPDDRLMHAYYPIISMEHPEFERAQTNGIVTSFAVLVRTSQFFLASDIPQSPKVVSNVYGLTQPAADVLTAEEWKYFANQFPNVPLEKVIVLQEGRRPMAKKTSSKVLAIGLGIFTIGILWLMAVFRSHHPSNKFPSRGLHE